MHLTDFTTPMEIQDGRHVRPFWITHIFFFPDYLLHNEDNVNVVSLIYDRQRIGYDATYKTLWSNYVSAVQKKDETLPFESWDLQCQNNPLPWYIMQFFTVAKFMC